LPRWQPVKAIITARLEKYRTVTEQWLAKHRIACKRLVMGPWQNLRERYKPGTIARWKAQEFSKAPCSLFIESDPRQAEEIARLSKRPVLCPAAGKVFSFHVTPEDLHQFIWTVPQPEAIAV
jgi:uncharacterized HAD superfamily protein